MKLFRNNKNQKEEVAIVIMLIPYEVQKKEEYTQKESRSYKLYKMQLTAQLLINLAQFVTCLITLIQVIRV